MTRSTTSPKGHMTLTIFNADGSVAQTLENHNRVLPTGRQLLLSLLKGDLATSGVTTLLGLDGFKPETFKADGPTDGQLKMKAVKKAAVSIDAKGLTITQTATADEAAKVSGGGIVLDIGKPGDAAKDKVLYNFADLPAVTNVEADQPLRVSFTLSME